jgi:hypothetical protein
MKITQIISETTTSGSIAPTEHGFVKMQTRNPSVYGNTKAGSLLKGKKTSKPYANSINEGAMKQLSMDLKGGPDGLSDQEFQKKYKMSKQEARKELTSNRKDNTKTQPVSEAHLEEDDIILVPGQGRKMKTGFVPHGQSRVDHEVEMARSDVLATMKNAKAIYELLKNRSEEEGLEGWVQEKLVKANDYLNSVKEYYDEKMMQQESVPPAGVIGNGAMGESSQRVDSLVTDALKIMRGSEVSDAVKALKAVLGDREYNGRRGHYNFYVKQILDIYNQQGVAEGEDEGIRPQGKILKRLHDVAIMSPTLTFQNFRQSGKEAIITDAMMACKIMKRHFLQNKNQPTAQFIYNLENEIYDFMRGRKLDTPDGNAYTMDLSDLSRGTLGKMQFQTKDSVAEGAKVDRMVKHVAQSEKKLGKSKDEAENIAWATANKRGMLDNKNKKA